MVVVSKEGGGYRSVLRLTPASKLDDDGFDRAAEVKAFDESKGGVKGLVDDGVTEVPRIFYRETKIEGGGSSSVPVVDLEGIEELDGIKRRDAVDKICEASKSSGFFQVVNHGIPATVLEGIMKGVRGFFEMDTEVKKQYYTRDSSKPLIYNSNFDLFTAPTTNWRDSFYCFMAPNPPPPETLPQVCRDILSEYSKQVQMVGEVIFGLLSEALGLKSTHLVDLGCNEGLVVAGHYYPPCPQPELTIGATEHADDCSITVLLQDQMGGLQVLYENNWQDIPSIPGALIINIGNVLQLITNDRFVSSVHRVLVKHEGPRISVAMQFSTGGPQTNSKVYAPMKQLLSEENPPKYREITLGELSRYVTQKGLDGTSTLLPFRL